MTCAVQCTQTLACISSGPDILLFLPSSSFYFKTFPFLRRSLPTHLSKAKETETEIRSGEITSPLTPKPALPLPLPPPIERTNRDRADNYILTEGL